MIQKLYLKPNPEIPLEKFSSLFPQLSIFSEIYLFIEDFKSCFSYVFEFAKLLKNFLQKYPFCKVHLNLVHPFDAELRPFYVMFSELVNPFNLEGYTYQVTPRLIIFPVLCFPPFPESAEFLGFLEQKFMPPGVLIREEHYSLASEKIERIFLASHKDHLLSLGYQELLSVLLEKMREQNEDILNPCTSTLIIDEKGNFFSCLAAYQNHIVSGNLLKNAYERQSIKELCPQCKYQLISTLENTPLVSKSELSNLHFRFGLSYFGLQKIELALSHFFKALEFSPEEEHGDVYLYLGLCKANLGEYALAIDYLKKANIWNYNAYFYLGFSYFQQKEYLKAQDALEKALSLNPPLEDKLSIALYLATTYRELQRFEKAIILLQELVKVAPEVREIYNLMGICYFKKKDYQEASECFQKAINLAPDSAIDYANLGLCLKALGKKEQAKFYCQKALSLDPSLDFAQKALEELAR